MLTAVGGSWASESGPVAPGGGLTSRPPAGRITEHPFGPVGDRTYAATVGQGNDNPYAGLVTVQRRGTTIWAERRPSHCPAEHRFAPNKLLLGWGRMPVQLSRFGVTVPSCASMWTMDANGLAIHSPPHQEPPPSDTR